MAEITTDSIQNGIFQDGQLVFGSVSGVNSSIFANNDGAVAHGKINDKNSSISAIGNGTYAGGYIDQSGTIISSSDGAFAHGYVKDGAIIASGFGAHAEGWNTQALADGAHAEGSKTHASGAGSHAEGYVGDGIIKASGIGAHAGGYAMGSIIDASGNGSFAHGGAFRSRKQQSSNIIASGDGAIAGGYAFNGTIGASGQGAIAGGCALSGTIDASGYGAIAWGFGNSEGDIIADADGAVAFGIGTKAYNEGMMAVGKYNDDKDKSILFVVGNGSNLQALTKSNAFWVKDTGTAHSQNGFYDESDIRKKDILSNISLEKSYELLDKCQEIIYTLKEDPNKKEQVGMIAQEVEEFFPEIVSTDNNGFKSLDYARLSVICLRLIKDLYKQVQNLRNQ